VKVVTSVGLDHTRLLGDSLAKIARAKIEAVRDGDHVVLGPLEPEAAATAQEICDERSGLSVWRVGHEVRYTARTTPGAAGPMTLVDVVTPRGVHRDLPCPLAGAHQHRNLATAIAAVDALTDRGHIGPPDAGQLRARLAATRWPGRLELIRGAQLDGWSGRVLLEGATNPQGVTTVAPEILRLAQAPAQDQDQDRAHVGGASGPPVLVFAAMDDKDAPGMLVPLPSHWPLVSPAPTHTGPRPPPPCTAGSPRAAPDRA
jgi:dihydrofolate synthase/folylpolyglutamate synthase